MAKKESAFEKALTVPGKDTKITIEKARVTVSEAFKTLAVALSGELTTDKVAEGLRFVREAKKIVENYDDTMKTRVKDILLKSGQVATEKGARFLDAGGLRLFMKPTRTGVDGKKFEAMLRAKDMNPEKHMNMKIIFEYDAQKALSLVANKKISQDELESCKYDESWTVETPKPSKEE